MLRKKLSRYWRIITTGFCFSTFGIGALVLVSTIFPIAALFNFSSQRKTSLAIRRVIQISFKLFVSLMSACGLISVTIKNLEALKNSKGQIIVANHPSLIDVVIVVSLLPQGDCVVKQALGKNFFLKNVVKTAYILATSDMDKLFTDCQKSLNDGNSLIIFPEGTRTVPNKKSKLSRGAAHMAINAKVDILPIHISCSPPGLLKHQKWYNVADKELTFVLEAKPIISIKPYLDTANKHMTAKKLTEDIGIVLGINS
jgi:1-acyl-sn-glycerol-3-phosphate acyltransferase